MSVCLKNTLLLSYIQIFSYLLALLDRSIEETHIAQIMLGFKVHPCAVAAGVMTHTLIQKAKSDVLSSSVIIYFEMGILRLCVE